MKKSVKKTRPARSDDASIAAFYDQQSEEEVVSEIESALEDPKTVLVPVPRSLLSAVLQLIAKKKKSA